MAGFESGTPWPPDGHCAIGRAYGSLARTTCDLPFRDEPSAGYYAGAAPFLGYTEYNYRARRVTMTARKRPVKKGKVAKAVPERKAVRKVAKTMAKMAKRVAKKVVRKAPKKAAKKVAGRVLKKAPKEVAKKAVKKAPKRAIKKAPRKAAKKAPKNRRVKRAPNPAFMKPMTPSPALAAVVGSAPLTRTEITKRLWKYIKLNKLQDPMDKRMIDADAALLAVFGGKTEVSMFEMTKLIGRHLSTKVAGERVGKKRIVGKSGKKPLNYGSGGGH